MALLIDREKPTEDLYKPHIKEYKPSCSYKVASGKKPRSYDSIDRQERYLLSKGERGHRQKILTEEEENVIAEYARAGLSPTEIHRLFGRVSYPTVSNAVKRWKNEQIKQTL